MKNLEIKIGAIGQAFDDSPEMEMARILRELADKLEAGALPYGDESRIRDINGNTVGVIDIRNENK